jgi:hypothetical protein
MEEFRIPTAEANFPMPTLSTVTSGGIVERPPPQIIMTKVTSSHHHKNYGAMRELDRYNKKRVIDQPIGGGSLGRKAPTMR